MSKREFGKTRDDKKKGEDVSVDEVYKEFLETFDDVKKPANMAWVRGDTVVSDKSVIAELAKQPPLKDRLYKPKSKLEELAASFQSTQDIRSKKPTESTKPPEESKKLILLKKDAEKKRTSNLENLKEELKRSQEERAERRRLREQVQRLKSDEPDRKTRFDPLQPEQISLISAAARTSSDDILTLSGSYDADPTTTNIYIANLDGKVTESVLCDVFGKFGPLASVKIMWPRTEEERARGKNAGFVAFMNRTDADRAIVILQNRVLHGVTMRMGWGKSVAIPPYPVYMPPKLAELMQPQPPTGLPFNCSLTTAVENKQALEDTENDPSQLQKTLEKAVVRVVVPTERALLHIVHRMVEFVCREGPMFEAMIMNREINNPMFRFLFDNKNPVHIYYRWKLYSILQGDSPRKWRTEDFRMFAGGSIWRPPPMNPFTQSMPTNLLPREDELPPLADGSERSLSPTSVNGGKDREKDRHSSGDSRGESPVASRSRHDREKDRKHADKDRERHLLSDRQRQHLEEMLKELTAERRKIADCMVWCLDHAQSAEEVTDCIAESLSIVQTPLPKKIARLYLVSDLLHNAGAKVVHAFAYRKFLQAKLVQIFSDLNMSYESVDMRMKKEQFKTRVMSCFRAWEEWAIYPNDFLIYLQNVFFGLVKLKDDSGSEDIEGEPVNLGGDEPLDGEPILTDQTVGLLSTLYGNRLTADVAEKKPKLTPVMPRFESKPPEAKPGFQRSKWEEVDPEQIEAQAITTSRWDYFEPNAPSTEETSAPTKTASYDEDLDGEEIAEDEDVDGVQIEDSAALSARMRAMSAVRGQGQIVPGLYPPQLQQQQVSISPSSRRPGVDSASTTNSGSNNMDSANEDRRILLREIELQVMQYQDELENGQRPRETGVSINQQVQRYREQLVAQASSSSTAAAALFSGQRDKTRGNGDRKDNKDSRKSGKDNGSSSRRRSRSSSRSPGRDRSSWGKAAKSSRRSSRSRSRSRSRSPVRSSFSGGSGANSSAAKKSGRY